MDEFTSQVNRIKEKGDPVGLVFYIEEMKFYKTYEEFFEENLEHIKVLIDYDPMQIPHLLNLSEIDLRKYIEERVKKEYIKLKSCQKSLNKVGIDIKNTESIRKQIEEKDGFVAWCDPKNLKFTLKEN